MTLSNRSLADQYVAAKAAAEAADAIVKALKAEIEATGQDRIIGEDADVIVSLQERKGNIDEKLLARFMSPDEIASCRKESSIHPVLRIKAKCKV